MSDVNLTLLGELSINIDGQRVSDFPTDKSRALLAYLALEQRRPHTRTALAGLLWPDTPERQARDNLRNTLYRVRRTLDAVTPGASAQLLSVSRHDVQFNAAEATVDAVMFQERVDALSTHEHGLPALCPTCVAGLKEAAHLYQGELLRGISLPDASAFEEWLLLRREYLHHQAVWTFMQLAAASDAAGDLAQAHAATVRWLDLDPYREDASRQLMRLLARQGMPGEALALYEDLRKLLRAEFGVEPDQDTIQLVREISAGQIDQAQGSGAAPGTQAPLESDWSEAPLVGSFYGRNAETELLRQWLVADRSRLVALLGMGGVGKSTLAAHTARVLSGHFDVVLWRSLVNAPPLEEVVQFFVEGISGRPLHELPGSLDAQLTLLLQHLRRRRCLLVLDNLETVMQQDQAGRMQPDHRGYGQMLEYLANHEHDSCLVITSREWPRRIMRMERSRAHVRSLFLGGLDVESGQQLIREQGLAVEEETGASLVQSYSGNPLALILIAQTIQFLYQGDAAVFLADRAPIFDDIRDVLDQQISRLTPLELDIMFCLTVARGTSTPQAVRENLVGFIEQREFLEALHSLQRRSLVERIGSHLVVQNVIIEYLTDNLIDQVCHEIETGQVERLNRTALLDTRASEHLRQNQARLFLRPICDRLKATTGASAIAARCRQLLEDLRLSAPRAPGYAAGNVLNLMLAAGIDVTGSDFSRLSVWQAYLRGHSLEAVDFSGADLRRSMFTDTFSFIWSVAYSPDGRIIAAGTGDGKVHLWRAATGQPLAAWRAQEEAVYALAFSPDGRTLASGGAEGSINLWDTSDLPQLRERGMPGADGRIRHPIRRLLGHDGAVQQVIFSPDTLTRPIGPYLVSASDDHTLRLWDLETGEALRVFDGHTDFVLAAALSPDSRLLASGGRDQTVRLWDVMTGHQEHVLTAHSGWVTAVAFSETGQTLASASDDGTIRLWEITGSHTPTDDAGPNLRYGVGGVRVLQEHEAGVQTVAFGPDGRALASGGSDHTVRLWDVPSGQARHILRGHTNWVRAVAFSPDGQQLASGGWDHALRLWDVRTGNARLSLQGHAPAVFGVAFSPDGLSLASTSSDRTVRVWDVATGSVRQALQGHEDWTWRAAFRPSQPGNRGNLLASISFDHTVKLWNTKAWQLRQTLENHRAGLQALAMSPDGTMMATGDLDGRLIIWTLALGKGSKAPQVFHELAGHANWCLSAAFSPDGSLLASSGADHKVVLWNAHTGEARRTLLGHSSGVQEVVFSPDGTLLASASWDRTVRLWDVASGEVRQVLHGHTDLAQGVAFSPDGSQLASSSYDHTVRLWEVVTGQLSHVLEGHTGWVFYVTFSPMRPEHVEGWMLASSSSDETIRLWDSLTGQCLHCWEIPGPYAGMKIAGATGISDAQRAVLEALGAA